MSDNITTLDQLKERVKQITRDRDWQQFHSAKNICELMTIESAELLQLFVWADNASSKEMLEKKREAVEDEVADVLFWILQLSWQHTIDLSSAFERKMVKNEAKYPIALSKGNTKKYTEL